MRYAAAELAGLSKVTGRWPGSCLEHHREYCLIVRLIASVHKLTPNFQGSGARQV